jgi:hypothetical protein
MSCLLPGLYPVLLEFCFSQLAQRLVALSTARTLSASVQFHRKTAARVRRGRGIRFDPLRAPGEQERKRHQNRGIKRLGRP